ncbi:MAG: FitA-like ribbon-helix-helix domain-containing protein [Gaiella sp.]
MGMIQVRNVPEDVHRALKARAASMGLSLSDYLNQELARLAALPRFEDLTGLIKLAGPASSRGSAAEVVRALRGPLPGDDEP